MQNNERKGKSDIMFQVLMRQAFLSEPYIIAEPPKPQRFHLSISSNKEASSATKIQGLANLAAPGKIPILPFISQSVGYLNARANTEKAMDNKSTDFCCFFFFFFRLPVFKTRITQYQASSCLSWGYLSGAARKALLQAREHVPLLPGDVGKCACASGQPQ